MANNKIVFGYSGRGGKGSGSNKAFDKKEYRKEVSRLASIANKRIKRLQKNNLTDSPALQRLIDNGIPKFSVRGKSFNELQAETSKLMRFLNSDTSTIRGINANLKTIAKNTGIKYNNMKDLKSQASKFFELSSKVEQYLRTVDDMASAIGYNQIWEVISSYTQDNKIALGGAETNIDDLVLTVTDILKEVKSDKDMHDFDMKSGWVFLD